MRDPFEKGVTSMFFLLLVGVILWIVLFDKAGWTPQPSIMDDPSIEHGIDYPPKPTPSHITPPARLRSKDVMVLVPTDGPTTPSRICHPMGHGMWRCHFERASPRE